MINILPKSLTVIMPPQHSERIQQHIFFASTTSNPLNSRGTPQKNKNTIQNYPQPERINKVIVIKNPPRPTPRHLHPPRPTVEDAEDKDVDMEDRDEDEQE